MFVLASRSEPPSVRAVCHVLDRGRLRLLFPYGLAGIEIPDAHDPNSRNPILVGRGEATAVAMQSDGVDLRAAFEGGFQRLARRRVPELEPASGRIISCPRNEPLALGEEFQAADGAVVSRECER